MEYIKSIIILFFVISTALCENCETYDFGTNFNNTFNHGNNVCNGMAPWSLGMYSELSMTPPHPDSNQFISPDQVLSCVSSYTFEMKSTGVLEVNIYMESFSTHDQLVVLANEVRTSQMNTVRGSFMLTPLSANYVNGWHVLRINLFGSGTFEGYLTFLGIASPSSKIIVDSFRYIPPSYEDKCYLYDEDFVAPTAPPTVQPALGDCVTYDFENNFEEIFTNNRDFCSGFSKWNVNKYASISINSPNSDSHKFISPQAQISCASSFTFDVSAGGIIEVNVYMEARSESDQIVILAKEMISEKSDPVTGIVLVTPLSDDYVEGWQVVRIQLTGMNSYKGYISIFGMASEESVILIDSFRYIPPNVDKDVCRIYESELFETTTPIPVTTPQPNGQECVTYNFEGGNIDFDMSHQLCDGYAAWNLGTYYSLDIDNIHPESSTYISPNASSSCISSFIFEMKPGGVVDVNVFMKSLSDLDYVIVLVQKLMPDGVDTVAGLQLYYGGYPNFVEGWNVLKVNILDFSPFNGYITLIGSMAQDSIVLIDSFRYIPPNNEQPCDIY